MNHKNAREAMKKFIVLYYVPSSAEKEMNNASEEDMKKGMEAWHAWAQKCGSGLVDLGTPLGNGQKITESGSSASDKMVVGYSVLQAESMDGVKEMLKGHPHLGWAEGCEIEAYECLPLPG
jgi:hypothetical protein